MRYDARVAVPWLKWLWLLVFVLTAVQVVIAIVGREPWRVYVGPACLLLAALIWTLPGGPMVIRADATGIRLSLWRSVLWADVESVQDPGRFGQTVVLRMKDGRERRTGMSPAYAARVAEVSGLPLK